MSQITMFESIAPQMIINERENVRALQRCPNLACTGELWNVECLSTRKQLWRVSSEAGGSYLIAGVTPACPWCGADLQVATKPEATPSTNGLLQPIGGTLQRERAESELTWN